MRPSRRRKSCKGKSTSYRQSTTRRWHALSSPRILSHPSHTLSGNVEAQPLISQLETAFTGLSSLPAAATPTPPAIDARDDIDMQPDKERAIRNEAMARGLRALVGRPARGGARGQKAEFRGVRRARAQGLVTAASARVKILHPLRRFCLEKDFHFARLIRKQHGQLPRPTSHRGNLDS